MIEVGDLSVSYATASGAVRALENISTRIERNEFVSVVGPSGCGKSTLMMCIAGLLKPSGGTIFIDGSKVSFPRVRSRRVRGTEGLRAEVSMGTLGRDAAAGRALPRADP